MESTAANNDDLTRETLEIFAGIKALLEEIPLELVVIINILLQCHWTERQILLYLPDCLRGRFDLVTVAEVLEKVRGIRELDATSPQPGTVRDRLLYIAIKGKRRGDSL